MALQLITELNSYSSFSNILNFVCLCQLFFLEVVTLRLEYICNMALQSFTEFNSYPFFSIFLSLSVFVFVLPHVFAIVFVFPIFTMTPMHFPKSRPCPTQNLYLLRLAPLKCFEGRGGPFPLSISDPPESHYRTFFKI